ncbi:hypothetical protein RJT34_18264 [Clitoria ternatea]|uniref:Uncharacterized protein n=1 Tax=Clitoria ternatea TaxID=43366 RepID=A0AAN9JB27_CLITE
MSRGFERGSTSTNNNIEVLVLVYYCLIAKLLSPSLSHHTLSPFLFSSINVHQPKVRLAHMPHKFEPTIK